jgi:eukaryotic-like serine/threonine-protein kinase
MSSSFLNQTTVPDIFSTTSGESKPLPAFIGPYKIEGLLSEGGMSILYLAIHPELRCPVVIKALSTKFLYNKQMTARFLREAEIIALTDHPNIVKLYSQGKWENGLYIAMEFIQGVSLKQFTCQKALTQNKALEIVLHVADALKHFHSHKIIHRDLKPENILITETGLIKVIDFGIAQLLEEDPETGAIGTPCYMSPEQKNKAKLTYSSDLYSLALIAYELILGRFSGGTVHLFLIQHGLREILEKALKINPLERYRQVSEFTNDLTAFLSILREDSAGAKIK